MVLRVSLLAAGEVRVGLKVKMAVMGLRLRVDVKCGLGRQKDRWRLRQHWSM